MISIMISGVEVVFSKFFSMADVDAVETALPEGLRRVLFIDTPSTKWMVILVQSLVRQGIEVVIRDHHDFPNPESDRDKAIHEEVERVRAIVPNAIISSRKENPACSSLVEIGEFADFDAVIADPDPDGLMGAMKALGVVYPELDVDAAVLDGPRSEQTPDRLSPMAMLLVKGMATLPPFNKDRPEFSNRAKSELFATFVAAVQGDAEALASLEAKVEAYEASVAAAEALIPQAEELVSGLWYVDTVGSPQYHLSTLASALEELGARVTVIKKGFGPIADVDPDGVQYSIAVVGEWQKVINLHVTLKPDFKSAPEAGIITNMPVLLHVCQRVWDNDVLPALLDMM